MNRLFFSTFGLSIFLSGLVGCAKHSIRKPATIGHVNFEYVYPEDILPFMSNDQTLDDKNSVEKAFSKLVEKKVVEHFSRLEKTSPQEFLSFFDELDHLPLTKEEKKVFSEKKEEEIIKSRIPRAKKRLVAELVARVPHRLFTE